MSQPLIMSFRPEAAEMCLDGRKTMTRRMFKGDMREEKFYDGSIKALFSYKFKAWRGGSFVDIWRVGKSIAIKPGRTAKAMGRVMCIGLRVEHVRDITEEDARREGMTESGGPHPIFTGGKEWYDTARDAFAATWKALYPSGPKSWDENPLVVVIEFRPLKPGEK